MQSFENHPGDTHGPLNNMDHKEYFKLEMIKIKYSLHIGHRH